MSACHKQGEDCGHWRHHTRLSQNLAEEILNGRCDILSDIRDRQCAREWSGQRRTSQKELTTTISKEGSNFF